MRRSFLCAPVALLAVLLATPVVASPALLVGLLAAAAVSVGISASQQPHEAWEYTDKYGWVGGAREEVGTVDVPLVRKAGTSAAVVRVCRDAILRNAQQFDLASLEAVSAGKQQRVRGRIIAPLDVRAIYRVRGVHEVKRSTIRCEIDRAGRVISTT